MKLEFTTISGRRMCRLTLAGATRTALAPETLATLHTATEQEREHHRQLQRNEAVAAEQVRECVSRGADASQARAELARVRHAVEAASERIDNLEIMAGEVRDDAAEAIAAQLRQQHADHMAAVAAALPPVPQMEN